MRVYDLCLVERCTGDVLEVVCGIVDAAAGDIMTDDGGRCDPVLLALDVYNVIAADKALRLNVTP